MFVLTIEARTSDPDALRRHVLTWPSELGATAQGWLGNTAGVGADGRFVMVSRFDSEEAAWSTSDRPEYEQWWQAARRYLDTPPTFTASTDVTGILAGGSDDAAAVRVTMGRAAPSRLRASVRRLEALDPSERADVIGGIVAWHGPDRCTEVLYLASAGVEESQRHGMRSTALAGHDTAIAERDVIDVGAPWLTSPPHETSGRRRQR